jgi:cytochrome c biogenesis protein
MRATRAKATDPAKPGNRPAAGRCPPRARWRCSPGSRARQARKRPPAAWQAIAEFMEVNVPEAERERAGEVLVRILNGVLFELPRPAASRPGRAGEREKTQAFMTQAVLA